MRVKLRALLIAGMLLLASYLPVLPSLSEIHFVPVTRAASLGGEAPSSWLSEVCTDSKALIETLPLVMRSYRVVCRVTSLMLQSDEALAPLELRLSIGATSFLRTVRRAVRRTFKLVAWSAKQWLRWTLGALAFTFLAAAVSLADRTLVTTWRTQGFGAFRVSVALGLAVYVRLLVDRRAPAIGKGMLAFAIVYGIAATDLVPDYWVPAGWIDDVAAVALASRCFMRLCPDQLVDVHAAQAARARYRSLRGRVATRAEPG